MTSSKNETQETSPSEVSSDVAFIPVTATILVPVLLDEPISALAVSDTNGATIVDIEDEEQAGAALEKVMNKARDSEAVQDAMDWLLTAVHRFQRDNPQVRGRLTPYLGVIPEMEI